MRPSLSLFPAASLPRRHALTRPLASPAVSFFCSVTYDPFRLLAQRNKVYGFVITVVENMNTVPTLFSAVGRHLERRGLEPEGPLWSFLTRRGDDGDEHFSGFHFWTNMEVRSSSLSLLNSLARAHER